jgi:pyrimidine oxygenase
MHTSRTFTRDSKPRMRRLEIGVFLPVGKNGFVLSSNTPVYYPSYADNLAITVLAEEMGLDYVFSMAKWRGFGGATHFWDASLESFSLTSALAAATQRIRLIATVNPLLFHPALMSKMAATIDDVSGGRLGLNIITGAIIGEYEQMGVLPAGYDSRRYEYAAEWVHVLKRLWSEERVTHHGEFFTLIDCVSEPKPQQRPHPFLVCAASSDEGLRFTAREAQYSFINGKDLNDVKAKSLHSKKIAAEEGRAVKTAVSTLLAIGSTDEKAEKYWQHLMDGADLDAISNMGNAFSGQTREKSQERGVQILGDRRKINTGRAVIGSSRSIANEIIALAFEGDVDSILLVFSDYTEGLKRFGDDVMPLLADVLDVGTVGQEPPKA